MKILEEQNRILETLLYSVMGWIVWGIIFLIEEVIKIHDAIIFICLVGIQTEGNGLS